MVSTDETPPEGRRARKRRATENAIELAAVRLALENGEKPVTVEAICELAEVSRATFFNYFPSKEAAIYGRPLVVTQGPESDAFLTNNSGNLPKGIFDLMVATIGHAQVNTDVARSRRELMLAHPGAAAYAVRAIVSLREQLVGLCEHWLSNNSGARRLSTSPRREAQLSVSIAETAATTLMDDWRNGTGDFPVTEDGFHESVNELATILDGISTR